jgi:hypothetical protein
VMVSTVWHARTKLDSNADDGLSKPLQLDSAFQLQEHLAALHYTHTASSTRPMTRESASLLAAPPPGTDRTLWLYELCRLLIGQCNSLIVGFLFDNPPCSAATCPEMRASEWQFLCAVHESPKSCCAIDYCCHTLDWAANVVTNPKIFPSRFVAPDGATGGSTGLAIGGGDRSAALKNLVNVFRRLHRIFAHAWFQHRRVFWAVESSTGLYVFFKTVCDLYDLLPAENYKLPPDAEGLEPTANSGSNGGAEGTPDKTKQGQQHGQQQQQQRTTAPTTILRPEQHATQQQSNGTGDQEEKFQPVGRTATRRHVRSSPSTGSSVGTVMEADEDESAAVARKLKQMHIREEDEEEPDAGNTTVMERDGGAEAEVADVPVIVMHGSGPIANVTPQAMKPEEALPLQSDGPWKDERLDAPDETAAEDKIASPMEPMTAIPDDDDEQEDEVEPLPREASPGKPDAKTSDAKTSSDGQTAEQEKTSDSVTESKVETVGPPTVEGVKATGEDTENS